MKNLIVIISSCMLFFNCTDAKKATKNNSEIKKTINLLIDNWHKDAAEANYNSYFNRMDNNSIFIGTDASENWNKKEFEAYSKPHFDKGKAWNMKPLERNIYFNEAQNTVWFDELLDTKMGVCRGSGVVEKTLKNWKIKHYVLSLTIPNENINKIFNINKVKDSLFLTTNY